MGNETTLYMAEQKFYDKTACRNRSLGLIALYLFSLSFLFAVDTSIFAAETVRFVGHIYYNDYLDSPYGKKLSIPLAKVGIFDKDLTSNDFLGEGYADYNGNFDISIDKAKVENADYQSGPDIFFKIYAQSKAGSVHERFAGYNHNPDTYVFDATFDNGSLAIWEDWSVSSQLNAGSLIAYADSTSPVWILMDEISHCYKAIKALDRQGIGPNPLKILYTPNGDSGYSSPGGVMLWGYGPRSLSE